MRGKGHPVLRQCRQCGITPAYAGKSGLRQRREFAQQDHPRVCGEKPPADFRNRGMLGSPPRMRGKGTPASGIRVQRRITPAYAGKSACLFGEIRICQDHPRVCGEKHALACWADLPQGSPPRMRGKVAVHVPVSDFVGITPAYAGKSSGSSQKESR